MSELANCPFCGSSTVRLRDESGGRSVECIECGAGSAVYGLGITREEVIGKWNRRYPTAWCDCGDSHTNESVCANCLAAESDGAPEIGTRYRDDAGKVVAVVAPADHTKEMYKAAWVEMIDGDRLPGAYRAMLDAIPEPSSE